MEESNSGSENKLEEEPNIQSYNPMKWVFGLKWYVAVSVFIFAAFLFFQIEESIKSRNSKKNEMDPNKRDTITAKKGIIRLNKETRQTTKRVSFSLPSSLPNITVNFVANIQKQIYNWWIRPWSYILFRNIRLY